MDYINGVAMYPALQHKHSMNNKYCVDLTQLSEEDVALLEEAGVNVKESEDKGRWIQLSSNYPANVYDSQGTEIPEDVVRTIGNGSIINVPLKTYTTKYKKETFTKVALGTVRLVKLEKFTPNGIEGGYVYEAKQDDKKEADLDDEIPF